MLTTLVALLAAATLAVPLARHFGPWQRAGLLVGVAIGPACLGLVTDADQIAGIASLGVISSVDMADGIAPARAVASKERTKVEFA